MLENQENNQAVELTVDEKLANADESIRLLSATRVKPLLDILGLPTRFYGYVEGEWVGEDTATVRLELEHLNKMITDNHNEVKRYQDRLREVRNQFEQLESFLDDNWDDLDESTRSSICNILGIEESVTKTVNVTITGTIDITAPRGYDWDNISSDLNYNIDISLENSDLEQDGYGWSEDDFSAEAD